MSLAMRRHLTLGLVAAAYVAATAAVAPAPSSAQEATADVRDPVWWALGDSYSSGEGIAGTDASVTGRDPNGGTCERANGRTGRRGERPTEISDAKAWSLIAYDRLFGERSRGENLTMAACTGKITDDIRWQLDQARAWSGEESPDVISFSFGGNNIGFAGIIGNCIDVPGAPLDRPNLRWGCDHSEDELRARVDALVGRSDDPMVRGTVRFPAMLDLAADAVRPGGNVIVLGYPQILEEVGRWPAANRLIGCESWMARDVPMIRSVAGYLNEQLALAVQAADERHPSVTFHWLDVSRVYENELERHGLCSGNQQWLNGLTASVTSGDLRFERSYHPNQSGHRATGDALAAFVVSDIGADTLTVAGEPVTHDELLSLSLPAGHSCAYADDFPTPAQLTDGGLTGPRGGFVALENEAPGDVDGDRIVDGLAHLVCSSGASGTSSALVLVRGSDHEPVELPYREDAESQVAGVKVYRIYEMDLRDDTLVLQVAGHRPDDLGCCPTVGIEMTYQLGTDGPTFDRARVTSGAPGGEVVTLQQVFDAVAAGDLASARALADDAVVTEVASFTEDGYTLEAPEDCPPVYDVERILRRCLASASSGEAIDVGMGLDDQGEWHASTVTYIGGGE